MPEENQNTTAVDKPRPLTFNPLRLGSGRGSLLFSWHTGEGFLLAQRVQGKAELLIP